jgi:hypothetical protein
MKYTAYISSDIIPAGLIVILILLSWWINGCVCLDFRYTRKCVPASCWLTKQ